MKLVSATAYVVPATIKNFVFLKLETDEGLSGVGECTIDFRYESAVACLREGMAYLIGKDPIGIEEHWANLNKKYYWNSGALGRSALAAIDMALWDIAAKKLGVPLYQMFGGPVRDHVKVYLNIWWRGATNFDELRQKAAAAVSRGATGLKWYPYLSALQAHTPFHMSSGELSRGIDEVFALRDAMGPDIELMVDLYRQIDAISAVKFCRAVEKANLVFVEEPTPSNEPESLKQLSELGCVAIATGERYYSREDFRALFELQAVHMVQPSLIRVGGLTEARKIAAMAEAYSIGFAPHNPYGPVATAAAVHLCAATPNFVSLECYPNDFPTTRPNILTEPFEIVGDRFPLPTKPGLGIELDEDNLKAIAIERLRLT